MEDTTGNSADDSATVTWSDESGATTLSPDESGTTTLPSGELDLQVYGLPGYRFYLIHATAMTSLCLSMMTSITVIAYMNYPFKINFYTRSIGTR